MPFCGKQPLNMQVRYEYYAMKKELKKHAA